jgi:isochorismate hydrolase
MVFGEPRPAWATKISTFQLQRSLLTAPAGVATSSGVESTARQAYENGFHVTLAIDAMTDRSMDAHNYSLSKIFPRLGETGKTQEILDLLIALNKGA